MIINTRKFYRKIKSKIFTLLVKNKCSEFGSNLKVNGRSKVTKNTVLGENVNFNGLKIKGGGSCSIGNNFHSGEDCLIITEIHNYENATAIPYDSKRIFKEVVIEDNVWLGDRVIILGGVKIGEGAIIQAGSCVVSDIPMCSIAGGHPAKTFGYRDKENYFELKEKGCFH